MKTKITIEFDNEKAAKYFALWMCDSIAEQEYWEWMRYREEEEEGDITVTSFNYHQNGKFMGDNTIRTKCGRLTK